MKICCLFCVIILFLTGCRAQETFETLNDSFVQSVSATPQTVLLDLPEDIAVAAMEGEDGATIYLCDGYTITFHIAQSGDLEKTLRETTGFSESNLTVLKRETEGIKRYECVWTAIGEGEEQVGRACILDDGNCHYILTVMTPASTAGKLQATWNDLKNSFHLSDVSINPNTGS